MHSSVDGGFQVEKGAKVMAERLQEPESHVSNVNGQSLSTLHSGQ